MEICFSGDRNQQQERVKPWIKKPDYKDGWSRRRAARSEVGQTTEAPRARSRRQHSQQQLFFLFLGVPPPPRTPHPSHTGKGSSIGGGTGRLCPRTPTMELPWLLALTALLAHATTVSTSLTSFVNRGALVAHTGVGVRAHVYVCVCECAIVNETVAARR